MGTAMLEVCCWNNKIPMSIVLQEYEGANWDWLSEG
jgi:hypothetical protein